MTIDHPRFAARSRRAAILQALLLAAALFGVPATADDFDRLLASVGTSGTVPVLVTGWRAITGDEVGQGSAGGGMVAITGDEFSRELQAASTAATVTRRYDNLPVLAMRVDATALRHAKAYRASVEVWEDPILHPTLRESVRMVGADAAWTEGYTGEGLAVAVIDDGADVTHPFLRDRVIFEGCFADRCPNGQPTMLGTGAAAPVGTHGTHVAGIVLGQSVDDDLSGVGPGLRLMIFNVANRDSAGMAGNGILAALDRVLTLARERPGLIGAVNMSLGAERDTYGVCQATVWDLAADLFRKADIPVVVASGNGSAKDRAAPVGFPACVEGFVSVGAVDKTGQVAEFSNSGPTLDVLAPGVDIQSSVLESNDGRVRQSYDAFDGTSMAAPHVAGAMALLRQAAPQVSVGELLGALKATGQRVADTRQRGAAAELVHVQAAIEQLAGEAPRDDRTAAPEPPFEEPSVGEEPTPEAPEKDEAGEQPAKKKVWEPVI